MSQYYWTVDKTEQLRTLILTTEMTADQIGSMLGFSRSSILGKAHRLGLSLKERGIAIKKVKRERQDLKSKEKQPEIWVDEDDGSHIPIEQRKSLLELKDHCRYPFNQPGKDDFFFCGAIPKLNKPYCEDHCKLVYQKVIPYAERKSNKPNGFSFKRRQ